MCQTCSRQVYPGETLRCLPAKVNNRSPGWRSREGAVPTVTGRSTKCTPLVSPAPNASRATARSSVPAVPEGSQTRPGSPNTSTVALNQASSTGTPLGEFTSLLEDSSIPVPPTERALDEGIRNGAATSAPNTNPPTATAARRKGRARSRRPWATRSRYWVGVSNSGASTGISSAFRACESRAIGASST
jgi:hypothetical protein